MSSKYQQLNRLFSQCVDGNRIRIPDSVKEPPKPSENTPPFVLDVLHVASREVIERRSENLKTLDGQSRDTVQTLLCRDRLALPDFELMRISMAWCNRNEEEFTDHLPLFALNALTDEQKV